ncbi:MAG: undecaprenyl-diphosphate phosphatase [Oscillospiraceae bacterium]|nr:undecaprenyl-diphosphate phosphatase [Oscillospiraceae bacterium]
MTILDWLKVIFLGIVEGVTEWLPISSTGHMILVDALWKTENHPVLTDDFMKMFTVVIQLGAILAVVFLYFRKLWPFHTRARRQNRSWFAEISSNRLVAGVQGFCDNYCYMDRIVMWLKIAVSCLPAIIIGLPLDDWMEAHLFNPSVVAAMLILYGVGFLFIERYNKRRTPRIRAMKGLTWADAALIGIFQVLSLVPGTSRSGATILGGILIGASRELAAEYTFYLAIPVMFGASLLKLVKFGFAFTGTQVAVLLIAMAVAFVVSVIAIKFLMGYIKKHDFSVFGWYRIGLGLLVLLYFLVIAK